MALKLNFQRFLQTAPRRLPTDSLMTEIDRVTGGNIFKNLDWLLNDDDTNVKGYFKSLSGTMHPVLNTISEFINNKSISYGLVVNLSSQIPKNSLQINNDQIILSKVTEMLRMAILLHNDIVNTTPLNKRLHKGNKISLLCGDYLLTKCLYSLITLKDHYYVEYMSSALRDLTLGRTLGPMDQNGKPYPSKLKNNFDLKQEISILNNFSSELFDYKTVLGHPINEWIIRNSLNAGNLLGKGISSVFRFGNLPESIQNVGFNFGKYFALILKANEDIYEVLKTNHISLTNLLVYIYLKKHPEFYKEIENNLDQINYEDLIFNLVQSGSLDESFEFRNELISSALSCLSVFDDSYPKVLMKELILDLKNVK
ncbi:uncharacterized protein [Onthophagus taurus]|uniref:uncharacterized protein n=1 Tax=Onthophagus taurus TaxID=166361 RepID=UPI0039BE459B